MSKLSKSTHELLNDNVLACLSKKRVNTTLTFVETSSELLAKITGLQFRQVVLIKDSILIKSSSKVRKGSDFYKELLTKGAIMPTGIESLDGLLDGGVATGSIYELCGGTSCGKSQICMAIAANVSHGFQQNVFYIDTKGDFSAHRLCNFLEKRTDKVGEALLKIRVTQPANAYQLLNCLHDYVKRITEDNNCAARLMIIDSLAALFYQFIGGHNEGNNLLSSVSSILQYIAAELHTAIIVTNLVTNWQNESDEVQKASLGKFWSHVPSARLNMTSVVSSDILLTVVKSSGLPLGRSVTVSIGEDRIA